MSETYIIPAKCNFNLGRKKHLHLPSSSELLLLYLSSDIIPI